MNVETKRMGNDIAILYLSGSLRTDNLKTFKEAISEVTGEGFTSVLVDCRELGFISSSGLASLLWAKTTAKSKGGNVYFSHVSATVAEVLAITKLGGLLSIVPTTHGFLERKGLLRKNPTRA